MLESAIIPGILLVILQELAKWRRYLLSRLRSALDDMKQLLPLLVLFLYGLNSLCGQSTETFQLKGTVLDAATREALIGVNIQVKGTQTGAVTDLAEPRTEQRQHPHL